MVTGTLRVDLDPDVFGSILNGKRDTVQLGIEKVVVTCRLDGSRIYDSDLQDDDSGQVRCVRCVVPEEKRNYVSGLTEISGCFGGHSRHKFMVEQGCRFRIDVDALRPINDEGGTGVEVGVDRVVPVCVECGRDSVEATGLGGSWWRWCQRCVPEQYSVVGDAKNSG